MTNDPERLSAEQLDAMTPHERLEAFRERIVTDPDELPEHFRRKIFTRAAELGAAHADRT